MNKTEKSGNGIVFPKTKTFQTFKTENTRNENGKKQILITGGAGFIGTNLAHRLLSEGHQVIVMDILSRSGVEKNLSWLLKKHGGQVKVETVDVRNADAVKKVVKHASQIFHFAAQVAVTTSLYDPFEDFEINARGTLNLLEAVRAQENPPPIIFTSTNKVYGALDDIKLTNKNNRYQPENEEIRKNGVSEARAVEFHSPYGCSKGAADQYVLDYARTFCLPTMVFRMSCIYGEHQCGTEDQGWVAHFLINAIEGKPITIYGDGMQVRDVLFADDLVNAFLLAQKNIKQFSGQAFNIGGGTGNSVSLLELIEIINDLQGEKCKVRFAEWRHADQRYYVSDTRKFETATSWKPNVNVQNGVEKLYRWLLASRNVSVPARTVNTGNQRIFGEAAVAGT